MYFSVLMPTYNQASFIRRAIVSLQGQTYGKWELIIINDGSTDETEFYVSDFLSDKRIRYFRNEKNTGLGAALNQGLIQAKYDYIAYLPSDDYYFESHLETLAEKFAESPDISLTFSGVKYETSDTMSFSANQSCITIKKGYCLQLVQTSHRKSNHKWLERSEWVTENLASMYWHKLLRDGIFAPTRKVTCYWTNHPHQRHKILGEKYGGGLNYFRSYYGVSEPIRLKVSKYKFVDEEKLYGSFRKQSQAIAHSLKILIVGELAYNPERIYALEEAGHKLYGLWVQKPSFSFNTVGHLPFGHVEDIPYRDWKNKVEEVKPDIIYGLLNFGAVPLAYEVLTSCPQIPFVWHFKEGPSVCLRQGTWNELLHLYSHADGRIYLNETIRIWYEQFIPSSNASYILDGDLPKADYFTTNFSPKLSAKDGAIHTVIAGRMVGISTKDLLELSKNNIHIHLYTENYHDSREKQINEYKRVAPSHFHVHPHCSHSNWVKEFSQYDAGWLHSFESQNQGSLMKASWDDLNIPARINTYMAAGLPVIQKNNKGHIVATETKIKKFDIGILFKDCEDLCLKLRDQDLMEKLACNVMDKRMLFSFDYHVPALTSFFRKVIEQKKN
ncbi:glycosyl transferase family 2 [Sunxiuqinia dokdonensis]|uniref:Glycosyl transferase family 2 n=2 Tax=Sunxiuqinia dokdonensis TaxID=1409788 RepID=A0A0L8V559_9BACT|nr:glycosyl transferase family 2 [Sunxiuqinia dokdonensis]